MTSMRLLPRNGKFGVGFFQHEFAAKKGKNVFVSPTSAAFALAMAANGATGATRKGMVKALAFDFEDYKTNNVAFSNLAAAIAADRGVQLKIANSIWAREGFTFGDEFIKENSEFFKAELKVENFADPETVNKINKWCSDNTEEKITEMLKEIPGEAILYIINAVYFKADWATKFNKDFTHEATFYAPEGEKQHPLMFRKGDVALYADKLAQAVRLPFGKEDGDISMYVMLPQEGKTLEDLVAGLTADTFWNIKNEAVETEIELFLPKFEVEYENELNETLKALGMPEAFGSEAEFDRLLPGALPGQVKISRVKQKTFGRVDEEGAEAAAVTVVEFSFECVMAAPPQFRADRPFVMAIVDDSVGEILFLGSIVDPKRVAPNKTQVARRAI